MKWAKKKIWQNSVNQVGSSTWKKNYLQEDEENI